MSPRARDVRRARARHVLAGLVKKIDRSVTVASVDDPAGLDSAVQIPSTLNVELLNLNPEPDYDLSYRRVAFVTGASRGIGRAIAPAWPLWSRGRGRGARENAQGTVDAIRAAGGQAEAVALEVTDAAAAEAALAARSRGTAASTSW